MGSRRALKSLARTCLDSDESNGDCEVLHRRNRGRGMLMRATRRDGSSVIIKSWESRNFREHVKRLLGVSNARREWRAHRHIEKAGLLVPRPLHFFQLRCGKGKWFEVVVVEDVGATTNGMVYLKGLVQNLDEEAIQQFEDRVLDMTERLVSARIADDDHQLRNVLINGSSRLVRVDFECARPMRWRQISDEMYGRMLANLVCSHLHACQPEVMRSESFGNRLIKRLHPSDEVRGIAKKHIHRILNHQHATRGVDSRLRLDW